MDFDKHFKEAGDELAKRAVELGLTLEELNEISNRILFYLGYVDEDYNPIKDVDIKTTRTETEINQLWTEWATSRYRTKKKVAAASVTFGRLLGRSIDMIMALEMRNAAIDMLKNPPIRPASVMLDSEEAEMAYVEGINQLAEKHGGNVMPHGVIIPPENVEAFEKDLKKLQDDLGAVEPMPFGSFGGPMPEA